MNSFGAIWVHLSASPLFWLTATVVAYLSAHWVGQRLGGSPLANSVLIASGTLVCLLAVSGTEYPAYFEGAQFVHFLLGPATVALAVPLFKNLTLVKSSLLPIAASLVAGSLTAIGSAVGIVLVFGAPKETVASIAPKSTSAPIAMELARSLGGVPSLAAVLVILTGITGAILVTPLMNLLRIKNFAARGFAVGVASHGIGTARAFQVSEVAGAFAGIAMALNGALTSVVVMLWSVLT